MNIEISQHYLAIGATYDISVDGVATHSAKTEGLQTKHIIKVYRGKNRIFTITEHTNLILAKYHIHFQNNNNVYFHGISGSRYQCVAGKNTYDVYIENALAASVYKNKTLIATWKQQGVLVMQGDQYAINVLDISEHELIMVFCLIIDDRRAGMQQGLLTVRTDFFGMFLKWIGGFWEKPKA